MIYWSLLFWITSMQFQRVFFAWNGQKPCQNFLAFMLEFLWRTSLRTFEAENVHKNKHIQPQSKFRCSHKKMCNYWLSTCNNYFLFCDLFQKRIFHFVTILMFSIPSVSIFVKLIASFYWKLLNLWLNVSRFLIRDTHVTR